MSIRCEDSKYRYKPKKTVEITTYFYAEKNQEFFEDFPKIIQTCAGCRVTVKNSFSFSLQTISFKKKGVQKIFCITDTLFDQNSQQMCFNKDIFEPYNESTLFNFLVDVTSESVNITFVHVAQSPFPFTDMIDKYLSWNIQNHQPAIRIQISGASIPVNQDNLEVTYFTEKYYPFTKSVFGNSLLNSAFAKIGGPVLIYRLPDPRIFHLGLFDLDESLQGLRFTYLVGSCFFLACTFVFLMCLIFYQSSTKISRVLNEDYHHMDIIIYSMFYSTVITLDIVSGQKIFSSLKSVTPILLCYVVLSIISKFAVSCFFTFITALSDFTQTKLKKSRLFLLLNNISTFMVFFTFLICVCVLNKNFATSNSFLIDINVMNSFFFHVYLIYLAVFVLNGTMAGISILLLALNRYKIHNFVSTMIIPNIRSRFSSVAFSFLSVIFISLSFMYYIFSTQETWSHQSFVYLMIAYFIFLAYLLTLLVGFNGTINVLALKRIGKAFNYKPGINVMPRDFGNYLEIYNQKVPKNVSETKDRYIETFFDDAPVFKRSTVNPSDNLTQTQCAASPTSHFEPLVPDYSLKASTFRQLDHENAFKPSLPMVEPSKHKAHHNDSSGMFKTTVSNDDCCRSILTSTPTKNYPKNENSDKSHKKYPRTPYRAPESDNRLPLYQRTLTELNYFKQEDYRLI
ncbi:hypothetical protein RF11_00690 [Thelohanellus kitauei]|uniref:Uncharacterized protein n=1 Tax=Thelohanellus kitauei TaxID=669202 RepID=A0A0C2NKX2_THEKT|nr:hypothetical protein RF11_00690 [Thelohanellus kitauei]